MVRGRNDWGQSGVCGERGLNGRREKPYYKGIIFPRYRVKTRKVSGRNARAKFLPSLVVLGSDPLIQTAAFLASQEESCGRQSQVPIQCPFFSSSLKGIQLFWGAIDGSAKEFTSQVSCSRWSWDPLLTSEIKAEIPSAASGKAAVSL